MLESPEVGIQAGRWRGGERWTLGLFSDVPIDLAPLGRKAADIAGTALAKRGFRPRQGQQLEVALDGGRRSLQLLGLGKKKDFDALGLRSYVDQALDSARRAHVEHLVLGVPDHESCRGSEAAARLTRRVTLSGYRFDRFLKPLREGREELTRVDLAVSPPWRTAYAEGRRIGAATAAGVALARDLANTPPNIATPAWMARRSRELARRWRARITVLGPGELKRRGLRGLLAVGGGSRNPPQLVRIELGRGAKTVALVGKGVTFDTGGISIKPSAQMEEMKWDKAGACGVLGALEAVHRLALPIRIRAYLPLAENMPDGAAYRPGDIVEMVNGKSVEIFNTDAEGRMILADALVLAAKERPDHLLEYSTLTGACVVALGTHGAGLFTPDDALARALLSAAETSGERVWRLPLWPEFLEEMRGGHSDLKNSGGRWGGACTAAAFLSQFVEGHASWAHFDIAGPAYVGGDQRHKRGATGFGVSLTVDFLTALARSTDGRK